jgi:hypothetical protein
MASSGAENTAQMFKMMLNSLLGTVEFAGVLWDLLKCGIGSMDSVLQCLQGQEAACGVDMCTFDIVRNCYRTTLAMDFSQLRTG